MPAITPENKARHWLVAIPKQNKGNATKETTTCGYALKKNFFKGWNYS
jgi:hypothetical protein